MNHTQVTILGSNSAVSVKDRFPSGQVFSSQNSHVLIDCGEGTQFRMSQYKIKRSKIKAIFITHLHGDHVFGLPGLVTSYQLAGRKDKLTIFGPKPIKKYLDLNLGGIGHFISFPLEIIELEDALEKDVLHPIYEDKFIEVEAFHLYHRITCFGYKISEKPKRPKISKEFIANHTPSVKQITAVLKGEDFTSDSGKKIKNQDIIIPVPLQKSYAYCSDTIFHEPLMDVLKGTTCIYHESTYLEHYKEQAAERFHSTALQAGIIANGASAQKLILGHYSSRYEDILPFAEEASNSFSGEIELAKEGKVITL
jgi:ribonuclease Z